VRDLTGAPSTGRVAARLKPCATTGPSPAPHGWSATT